MFCSSTGTSISSSSTHVRRCRHISLACFWAFSSVEKLPMKMSSPFQPIVKSWYTILLYTRPRALTHVLCVVFDLLHNSIHLLEAPF